MPALPTNLVRVGSTYKYRSRIPQDLLKVYHPKREVTESLRTTSLAEARRLLPAIQLKYQAEWANLRAALSDHLTELVITDSIQPTDAVNDSNKVRALTVAPLLGEAIKRIADETSVSSLFD